MARMCASSVLFLIRSFLLPAVINGEKATLETPTFAQKRQRTLDMLIRSLYQDLMPDLHKVQLLSWPSIWSRDLFLPILGWMYFSVIQAVLSPLSLQSLAATVVPADLRSAVFHCSPQSASAYCTTQAGYCCNADFLSRALSPHITFVLSTLVFFSPLSIVAPNTTQFSAAILTPCQGQSF